MLPLNSKISSHVYQEQVDGGGTIYIYPLSVGDILDTFGVSYGIIHMTTKSHRIARSEKGITINPRDKRSSFKQVIEIYRSDGSVPGNFQSSP